MNYLDEYERMQIEAIEKWKQQKPSVVSSVFGKLASPIGWGIRKVIPSSAIKAALDASNATGKFLAGKKDIIRDGKVSEIEELKCKTLRLSDSIANNVHNWAIGIATAEGAATGTGGFLTLGIDIPFIITFALRTVHKIGYCYGYEAHDDQDNMFILGILSVSGSNSMQEKVIALSTLTSIQNTIAKETWKKIAEKAVRDKVSKEGAVISIKSLARQLGINITKRKALQAIPIIGAIVGASVNAWFIKEVAWAARHKFQERWLADNNKI